MGERGQNHKKIEPLRAKKSKRVKEKRVT